MVAPLGPIIKPYSTLFSLTFLPPAPAEVLQTAADLVAVGLLKFGDIYPDAVKQHVGDRDSRFVRVPGLDRTIACSDLFPSGGWVLQPLLDHVVPGAGLVPLVLFDSGELVELFRLQPPRLVVSIADVGFRP